eukprot:1405096-Alexandrium_andersonii.AAC.1
MSASLVGSEMCIRDSGNRPEDGTQKAAESELVALKARCKRAAGAASNSCLLYTSDAADDM